MPNIRERAIAAGILLAAAGSIGFMFAYARQSSTQWQGLSLTLAFAGFLIAALGWARWIVPYEQVVEERHVGVPGAAESRDDIEELNGGIASLDRKKWLTRMLLGALGLLGIAALFPIASLGPQPDDTLFHTRWRRGLRMQREDGSFVRATDLNVDAVETVFPEGAIGDAQSVALVLRLPPGVGQDALEGYIAYSKVCTHAGCPVALYRARDRRLVCPCHQSVFDAASDAAVLEGPADHALPRLPLEIADDGYLRATGDFPEPVGPGFWERP